MIRLEFTSSKRRHQLEYLIGEPADVENICALSRLRCAVRLNIDADQLRVWIPLTERIPFHHKGRATPGARVHPGLVIRDEYNQFDLSNLRRQIFEKRLPDVLT